MTKKTYVLSDIHIGDNSPTCWYQCDYHEDYLKAVLDDILNNKNDIDEVIILGDLFDFWTYPPDQQPPSLDKILKANPNIFGETGKLTKVVNDLPGKVKYLRGNHDINITQADLDKIAGPSKIMLLPDVYVKDDVVYTHGHLYTMFNAPDNRSDLTRRTPVGQFVTRAIMHKLNEDIQRLKSIKSSIAVGTNPDGSLEVFNTRPDRQNVIYHTRRKTLDKTTFNSSWTVADPSVGSGRVVAVGINGNGCQEIFYDAMDTQRSIMHSRQTGPNSSDWANPTHDDIGGYAQQIAVGGSATGIDPAARLEVFYVGMDGYIYHAWQSEPNGSFGKHIRLFYWRGTYKQELQASCIAAVRNANRLLEFYYGDANRFLQHISQGPKGDWNEPAFVSIGQADNVLDVQSLALGCNTDGRFEIFYISKQSVLMHTQPAGVVNWNKHDYDIWNEPVWIAQNVESVAVGRNWDGRLEAFWIQSDSREIYHMWQTTPSGQWSTAIPLGTSTVASLGDQGSRPGCDSNGYNTVANMANQGNPGDDFRKIFQEKFSLFHLDQVTDALLDAISDWSGMAKDQSIMLLNDTTTTINQAKMNYNNLEPTWEATYGGGAFGRLTAIKTMYADADGTYLGWFAQKLALEKGVKLAVMGHTHLPKLGLKADYDGALAETKYVNCGFLCPALPDLAGTAQFTFAVIEHDQGPNPKLWQVKYSESTSKYSIEAPSTQPDYVVPRIQIPFINIPLELADRSCYVWVVNNLGQDLDLVKTTPGYNSHFVVAPPQKIATGQTVGFWVQDLPSDIPTGAEGVVQYQYHSGGVTYPIVLGFGCPFAGTNHCAGTPEYDARSGAKTWQQNQVDMLGHPFFVRFYVGGR